MGSQVPSCIRLRRSEAVTEASASLTIIPRMLQLLVGEENTSPSCWMLEEGKPLDSCFSPEWRVSTASSVPDLIAGVNAQLNSSAVILLPPWGRVPNTRSEVQEEVLLGCQPRDSGWPLIAVVPASSLISRRSERFRSVLFDSWRPTAVIYVSGGIAGVHSSFLTALVRLEPPGSETQVMHVFSVPQGQQPQSDSVLVDLRRNLRMSGGATDFGFTLRAFPTAGASLGFRDLDPSTITRRESLQSYGSATTLGELFKVRLLRVRPENLTNGSDEGRVRVISGRDVLTDGTIAPPNEDSLWIDSPESELAVGDILIRSIVDARNTKGFVIAQVDAEDLPATANSTLLALSPREPLEAEVRTFVQEYLRSSLARELVGELSGLTINASQLARLHVPLPDYDMKIAIATIQHTVLRATEWQSEAAQLLSSIFDDRTAAANRGRILTDSRMLRSRIEAAEAIDDFGYKVRTLYPHPIALRWRIIEAAGEDDRLTEGHYRAVLNTVEVVLAYLACIGLSLAREIGEPVGALKTLRDNLSQGRGPTFGDWVAVLDELSGKRFAGIDELLGLPDFRKFIQDKTARDSVNLIRDRRNDESHVRGVDKVDLPEAEREAVEALTTILASTEFLVDLPLVIGESDHWDELSQQGRVYYRQLSGDHPIVRLQSMRSDQRVAKNSLYLMDTERRLHLLRPFLTAMHCPVCRSLSTFHIDLVSPEGPVLKSLEHGHQTVQEGLRDALIAVDLLNRDQGPAAATKA